MRTAVVLVVLFVFVCVSSACNDDGEFDAWTAHSPLGAVVEEPSYTILTEDQRTEATRQPWELPGRENLRPPPGVLEGQYGSREGFVPNPDGVELLDKLEEAWQEERSRLSVEENLTSAEVEEYFGSFHDDFVRNYSNEQ